MKIFVPLTLLFVICAKVSSGAYCGNDWMTYKDDVCLKLFNKAMSYNDTAKFCSGQSDLMYSPSLIKVKPLQLYSYLAQIGQLTNHSIWIGQSDLRENVCSQIDPRSSKVQSVLCTQLNLPLCQKSPDWTTEDIMRKITLNHDDIAALTSNLISIEDAIKKLSSAQNSINLIPIGFIYIEYRKQSIPSALWPSMKWTDVTSEFAGQFFRALGGDSAGWDQVQQSCAPTITNIENINSNSYQHAITLPTSGWSSRLFTGKWEQMGTATRFNIAVRFDRLTQLSEFGNALDSLSFMINTLPSNTYRLCKNRFNNKTFPLL